MNSRDRQLAAIRHEIPDRIPVDAICIEISDGIAGFLGIKPADVETRLGLDGRIVAAGGYSADRPGPDDDEADEWGVRNTLSYGTAEQRPLAACADVAAVERYRWPDPARYDFADARQRARHLAGEYAVRGPYWMPLFCRVCSLFGMEEAMARMVGEPDVFEAALQNVYALTASYCSRLLDACGEAMPILCLGDDFATQRGLMISPDFWRKYLKPRYAKLFEIGKEAGKYVWFHSCGDITAVLPDLIDIGMDVWETVQLHTLPLRPEELKREYGSHITFFGGVNTQRLPFVTPDEVTRETVRCIEVLGKDGGYICGPDHHIKPDVPPANAVALFDAALGFRQAGYTQSAP